MNERERNAVEALLVSRLRTGCGEGTKDEKQCLLTDFEKKSLDCMKPGYIEQLLRSVPEDEQFEAESEVGIDAEPRRTESSRQLALGLNRADVIDQSTSDELDHKRSEILDRLREERRE